MLVVLNRSSPVNYSYRLDGGLQYRIIEKMIVFRKEGEEVDGLYFHDSSEMSSCFSVMGSVIRGDFKPVPEHATVNEEATASLMMALGIKKDSPVQPQPEKGKSKNKSGPQSNQQAVVIDKKSLQLTLLSLIQDERFIDLIHAQYLKVVNARGQQGGGK